MRLKEYTGLTGRNGYLGSRIEAFKLLLQQRPDKITATPLKSPLSLLNRSKSGGRKWEDVSSVHSKGIGNENGEGAWLSGSSQWVVPFTEIENTRERAMWIRCTTCFNS